MTLNSDAWNPAAHPRDTGSGRFTEKTNSAPEAILGHGQATGLLTPVLDEVPYHQRVAQSDNPVLAGFFLAEMEGGSTPKEWLEAIEAYFDDPETAPRTELYNEVRDLFGQPRDENDVDDWYRRTAQWRDQATQLIRTTLSEPDDVELDEVPEHSNDIGDWCPYSGTMQPGGECPQWCRQASDPDYDPDDDDDDD